MQSEVNRLRRMIRTDELTGVLNRRGVMEEFTALFDEAAYTKEHKEAGRRKLSFSDVAVLFFDIDNFKSINDTFGHEAGDRVLAMFIQEIAKSIRGLDRVGRLGGEEFVVLLVGASEEEGKKKGEHLLDKIRALRFKEDNMPEKITASAGVASIASTQAKDVEQLIKAADNAMYDAKKNKGKDTIVAHSEIS